MLIRDYFQLLVPWLIVAWLLAWAVFRFKLTCLHKFWQKLLLLALAAVIALVPVGGLSLADYLLSFNPSFSIGSLVLVAALLWPKLFGRALLPPKQLALFCLFNVIVSLVLFLSCLGLIPLDLYALGYSFSAWFAVMAITSVAAAAMGSSLAIVLICYIAAFDLYLLPSPNFFDYITDGFLFLASLAVLSVSTLRQRSN